MHVWMRRVFISIRDSLSNLSFLSPDFIEEIFAGSEGNRRLRVDTGEAGFFEGRQFGFAHEFELNHAGNNEEDLFIRITTPTNLILRRSEIVLVDGGVRYDILLAGTPSGTYDTPIDVFPLNTQTDVEPYSPTVTVATGDTASHTATSVRPLAMVRAAGGNQNKQNVLGTDASERGFAPNTYYVRISKSPAAVADNSIGVLFLEWEERP